MGGRLPSESVAGISGIRKHLYGSEKKRLCLYHQPVKNRESKSSAYYEVQTLIPPCANVKVTGARAATPEAKRPAYRASS
jgi:hypothetical protein